MSQSKIRKITPQEKGRPSSSTGKSPSPGNRDEMIDLVQKIADLTSKKPDKAAKLLQGWLGQKSKKKAA